MRAYTFLLISIMLIAGIHADYLWNSTAYGNSLNLYSSLAAPFVYNLSVATTYNVPTNMSYPIVVTNCTKKVISTTIQVINGTTHRINKYKTVCFNATSSRTTMGTFNQTAYRTINQTALNETLVVLKHEDTLSKYTSSICLVGSTCNPDNYTANTIGIQSATNGFVVAGQDYAEIVNKNAAENLSLGDVICIQPKGIATKTINASCIDYGVVSGSTAGFIGGSKTADLYKTVNGTKVMRDDFTGATHVPIAFTGILKVKVNGTINAGDWVSMSYNNSGYGKPQSAVSVPSFAIYKTYVDTRVGVAWETNATAGLKTVLVRIGGR